MAAMDDNPIKSKDEWRKLLPSDVFHITRQHGTERAFSHPLNAEKRDGIYHCVCCGNPLFEASSKFDSGTGWPSFFQPVSEEAVSAHTDRSFFMTRTEIRCARCEAHLGHVFEDGPQPTGLRYCMNGTALTFEAEED